MLGWFKKIAFWEGVSYLVLLFLAMPLKYLFDTPEAVRWVGSIHGFLFVVYVILLTYNWYDRKWPVKKALIYFLASLIPFATFWVEKKVAEEQMAVQS